jgi:hypothetical protein
MNELTNADLLLILHSLTEQTIRFNNNVENSTSIERELEIAKLLLISKIQKIYVERLIKK